MKKRVYYYEDDNIKNKQIAARYKFSLDFVKNKIVADIGCGARRGPYVLSAAALQVIALDILQEAVAYSAKRWPRRNIIYVNADAKFLPFKGSYLDCLLSLEVIEHIDDYGKYLDEVKRVLKPGGIFIISTPNRLVISPGGALTNPDHFREFDAEEFKNTLRECFFQFTLYGQKPLAKVREAEYLLKQINQKIDNIPGVLKRIFPRRVNLLIRRVIVYFFARFKALPSPDGINEEDFVFEETNLNQARHFLAVCRK